MSVIYLFIIVSSSLGHITNYYTMNFMQGQGLAKSRSHAHV